MRKDIEWLRNKLEYFHKLDRWNWNQCEPNSGEQRHFGGCLAAYEKALDFLDELDEPEVPKQDLPVVPKHVADWLDDNIERYRTVRSFINSLVEFFGDTVPEKVRAYARENPDTMAKAYLDGYTVEKEPLYTARLKVITGEYVASYLRTRSSSAEDRLKSLDLGGKDAIQNYRRLSVFTEHELKVLGIWDSDQWVVEEVEE